MSPPHSPLGTVVDPLGVWGPEVDLTLPVEPETFGSWRFDAERLCFALRGYELDAERGPYWCISQVATKRGYELENLVRLVVHVFPQSEPVALVLRRLRRAAREALSEPVQRPLTPKERRRGKAEKLHSAVVALKAQNKRKAGRGR